MIQVHITYSMVGIPRKDAISSGAIIHIKIVSLGWKYADRHRTFQSQKDHKIETYTEIIVPGKSEYLRYDNTYVDMRMMMIMILLMWRDNKLMFILPSRYTKWVDKLKY